MTGLPFFRERYGARTVTGAGIGVIQRAFRDLYGLGEAFPVDGSQFDLLVDAGQKLGFGSLEVEAFHTPGHTPAHMSWRIGDAVFLGDSLAPVATAIVVARRTMTIVRQNFAIAIVYNALAVPLALLGLVTPLVAAIAMSGSSLIVVGNALRLRGAAR